MRVCVLILVLFVASTTCVSTKLANILRDLPQEIRRRFEVAQELGGIDIEEALSFNMGSQAQERGYFIALHIVNTSYAHLTNEKHLTFCHKFNISKTSELNRCVATLNSKQLLDFVSALYHVRRCTYHANVNAESEKHLQFQQSHLRALEAHVQREGTRTNTLKRVMSGNKRLLAKYEKANKAFLEQLNNITYVYTLL
mmetsp:Transcript_20527/g.22806  ORF Transcript_20527/g.22806 Transcript_20527/m.22806 type:complete len:198 (+) Transcript_20527:97-690(+)